jgi:hypothetical protein
MPTGLRSAFTPGSSSRRFCLARSGSPMRRRARHRKRAPSLTPMAPSAVFG